MVPRGGFDVFIELIIKRQIPLDDKRLLRLSPILNLYQHEIWRVKSFQHPIGRSEWLHLEMEDSSTDIFFSGEDNILCKIVG